MSNLKEKLTAIERVKLTKHSLNFIPDDSLVREIYLNKLIPMLIDLDCYISSVKESLGDSFYELYPTNTPKETNKLNKTLVTKYNNLKDGLISLFDSLNLYKTDFLILIIEKYILLAKTTNLQFIIFELLKKSPKKILNFFFKKLKEKKYFSFYVSFFLGIIVRFNLIKELEIKSINLFMNYLFEYFNIENNYSLNVPLIKKNEIRFIHLCQLFVYLCCFKKEIFYENDLLVKKIIKSGVLKKMNKKVALKFISEFKLGIKLVSSYEYNSVFEFFPFDPPSVYEIKERIEDCYVNISE
ncbi:hypothetical protein TUBRATIS_29000 [Tubulinosema ratisbonensis]|uniref:Uncharacterized protein n=1 Tax=Tubulinosema ratisbonensis TaxID=291195 RepID=A0A437AHW9_9MICR|nr:hypothetical protein TUBRATIS_29000 [Tubulinosema ratisbonensis]